jgi:hypothetical protein
VKKAAASRMYGRGNPAKDSEGDKKCERGDEVAFTSAFGKMLAPQIG